MITASPYRFTIPRTIHDTAPPTRGSCAAAASLGAIIPDLEDQQRQPSFSLELPPGSISLVSGPSGAGKSTLLEDIARTIRAEHWRLIRPDRLRVPNRPAVDQFGACPLEGMKRLTRAGLGEARSFIRRPRELSDGQRLRLRLALAMHRAEQLTPRTRPALLLLDEFAATLDPPAAQQCAILLRRFISANPRCRALVASPRQDLLTSLAPNQHITLVPGAPPIITPGRGRSESQLLTIERATMREYEAFARFHYRAGPPAMVRRVLVARVPEQDCPVGILTVSMPPLNGAWRALAWPHIFNRLDPAEHSKRLNEHVRTISRVIVEPRFRAMGIAARLVRAYLDRPITPLTEALATMGRCCRFFESAGMTAYDLPPSRRRARLLDALEHARIEPWRLATPQTTLARAIANTSHAFIEREVRRWAADGRSTRHLAGAHLPELFIHACRAVASSPIAYAHTAPRTND